MFVTIRVHVTVSHSCLKAHLSSQPRGGATATRATGQWAAGAWSIDYECKKKIISAGAWLCCWRATLTAAETRAPQSP
jgi:hypothetical protein